MSIKNRLTRLEERTASAAPYKLESPYLIRLCSELGIEPVIYPSRPEGESAYLQKLQNTVKNQAYRCGN